MAKKKKFGASLETKTKLLPVVQQKAPKTISTNVSTGGMRSAISSTAQSVTKSARQKAEEERSARMRQGLSSVVRSSFNRQMSRPTYINKNTVNRLNQLNKTVTNPLAPIKQKQVTGGNGVGEQRLFSKERSLLNNTKFVTGGQGVGGKTVVNSPIGRVKSSVLAPVKEDIQNNYYDAVRKVGMKGSRNERKVYVPLSQRDENGQISTNQRRLENAARGGNRKAQVEAALARTKAQTLMNGHTYDQIVNAELNKRGLMGQDYILRNLDPTEEAMEYRKRYGFDEEAKQAMLDLVNKNNGMNFGHDEAYRAAKVEDTLRRQYGVELTPEEQAQIDEARSSAGYMFGNMVGQGEQFALTAPASGLVEGKLLTKFGLKNGLKSIRGVDDALKYAGARIGADQIVSAPVNLLDALKEDNGADIIKRFGMNTAMDMIFSGLTEIPSLRKNVRFGKAYFLNQSANAMEEGAEKIATKQAAYNELLDAINENNAIESANNLDIYTEDLPSELTRQQANHLVDAPQTFDKPVSKVESTYDRRTKSYVIRLKDADGNNLGDPIRIGGKDRKNARVKELEEFYGLSEPERVTTYYQPRAKKQEPKKVEKVAKPKAESKQGDVDQALLDSIAQKRKGNLYHSTKNNYTEKEWNEITRNYKRKGVASLEKEKQNIAIKVSKGEMTRENADERVKLIDSIIEQKKEAKGISTKAEETPKPEPKKEAESVQKPKEAKEEIFAEDKEGWAWGRTEAGDLWVGSKNEPLAKKYYKDTPENRKFVEDYWKSQSFAPEVKTKKSKPTKAKQKPKQVKNNGDEKLAKAKKMADDIAEKKKASVNNEELTYENMTAKQKEVFDKAYDEAVEKEMNPYETEQYAYNAVKNMDNNGKPSAKSTERKNAKPPKKSSADDEKLARAKEKADDIAEKKKAKDSQNKANKQKQTTLQTPAERREKHWTTQNNKTRDNALKNLKEGEIERGNFTTYNGMNGGVPIIENTEGYLFKANGTVYGVTKNGRRWEVYDTKSGKFVGGGATRKEAVTNSADKYLPTKQSDIDEFNKAIDSLDFGDKKPAVKAENGHSSFDDLEDITDKPNAPDLVEKYEKQEKRNQRKANPSWEPKEREAMEKGNAIVKNERKNAKKNGSHKNDMPKTATDAEGNTFDTSQAYDTGVHSEPDVDVRLKAMQDVQDKGQGKKYGKKFDPTLEDAKARYESDPRQFEKRIDRAIERFKEGKLPKSKDYDRIEDFYADVYELKDRLRTRKRAIEDAGEKNSDEWNEIVDRMSELIDGASAAGSQSGSNLNFYKIFAGNDPDVKERHLQTRIEQIQEQYAKRLKGKELKDLPDDLKRKILDTKDPEKLSKYYADASIYIWNQIPASFKEKADFFRINAMLFNPKTHIRNFFGNVLFSPLREMKDINGTIIEAVAEKWGLIDKSSRRKAFRPDKEGMEYAKTILDDSGDAIRGANKLLSEIANGRPIDSLSDMFMAGRHDSNNPIRKGIWKALDGMGHLNSKLLDKEDMIFFDIAFRRQYGRAMKARGLSVQDLVNNPKLRDELTELSASEALRAVYRDNSAVSRAFSRWKHPRGGGALQKGVGIAIDSVMPFTKTPINIVRRALEYSPAGGAEGIYHVFKGLHNANPKMIVRGLDEVSSGLTGSALMAIGYFAGAFDKVTVKLGDDDESRFMRDIGKQNFSLVIGNEDNNVNVSLDWAAPGCIPFFTGAALANAIGEDGGVNIWEVMDVAEQMFEPMVEMSVMQGIKNTLESFQKESGGGVMQGIMSAGLSSGLSYIGQFNPTIVGQVNKTFFDRTRRDTSSTASQSTRRTVEKWAFKQMAKWPVFSQLLPEYKNVWAETQSNTWSKNPAGVFLENFWSPGYIKDYKPDSVEKELIDVYEKDKTVEGLFPQKNWKGQVTYNGGTLKLEKKEVSAYNDIYGKASKNKLKELFASSAYKNASVKEKQKMIKEVYEEANTEATQKVLLDRGYNKWDVLTDDLSESQQDYKEAKEAGLTPEQYRKYAKTTDFDMNGNGKAYKSEWAIYLNSQDLTDEERAALWSLHSTAANPYLDGTAHTTDWQAQYQKDLKSSDKRLATNLGKVKAREGGVASNLFNKTVEKELADLKAKGITGSSSGSSSKGSSGRTRRSGGGSGSRKARAKTASEKRFSALQKMQAPTTGKGIEALAKSAKGLTKAQKKALIKLLQKKLDV